MGYPVVEVPEVVVKPGIMLHRSLRMKVVVGLLGLVIYMYLLIFIKTLYLSNQRLDHIMDMAVKTEKLMQNVHIQDAKVAAGIRQLESFYEGH